MKFHAAPEGGRALCGLPTSGLPAEAVPFKLNRVTCKTCRRLLDERGFYRGPYAH